MKDEIKKEMYSYNFLNFLKNEIDRFLLSKQRNDMMLGEKYYMGNHNILKRVRTVIGKNGETEEIENLPNNRIVDNQYARMVDQKNSYLLAKPITFYTKNNELLKKIDDLFDKSFLKIIKNIGEDCINCGIGFLYVYLDEMGNIRFKKFRPYEVIPFWEDEEHTKLDMLVRFYDIQKVRNNRSIIMTQVEAYTKEGVAYYLLENNNIIVDKSKKFAHYMYNSYEKPLLWGKIPIIPFKFNSKEIPLINKVKTLQDALNIIRSDFMNNMQEDARNTILILKNYDGTDISEFRKNLSEYGLVKVKTVDGQEGGVETLKINVDSKNYEIFAKTIKRAITENARGYDQKDDKAWQNSNQMGIKNMYADIDLDANLMEAEFQESFENILQFVKKYTAHIENRNFENEKVDVIFNRDILINESEAINNCVKSRGILSKETILSKHPFVTNVDREMEKIQDNDA